MAKQTIGIGAVADDGDGDELRTCFVKTNDNFTELYSFKDGLGTAAVTWSALQSFDQAVATSLSNPYFTAVAATPGFRAIQTLVTDVGTPASSAALGAVHLDASGLGTAALDDIASSISFGRKGAGRRGAMIAGLHTSSDVNQMGIGVWCKSSSTAASSAVVLRWKWDHAGNYLPAIDNNVTIGNATFRLIAIYTVRTYYSATVFDASGAGTPEGVVTAGIGSTYRRTDGGAGTSFYVKESGTGASGWVGK